jgi:serine O-acetyltransferase
MSSDDTHLGPHLGVWVRNIVASYDADPRTRHIDRVYLPNRGETVRLVRLLMELLYPGLFGRQHLTRHNVAFHVGDLLPRIYATAYQQIYRCMCYFEEERDPDDLHRAACRENARRITSGFIESIPAIRGELAHDVQAAYDGDPAAINFDEIILAYPGLLAISVYRLAHDLTLRNVPFMPRIMTEWAHSRTGIDIHPGASIGRNFFIDHGTGVVIGETTEIGDNVKVYQGVTLGALSFPKDERGRIIRGTKRHPTVRDRVTIYANAIVLGGDTVIGENAVIGGGVFLTSSIPPNSVVTFQPPELRFRNRDDAHPPAARADRTTAAPPTRHGDESRDGSAESSAVPPGIAPAHLPDYVI